MSTPKDLTELIQMFITIGMRIIPLLGAVAFLVFAFGVGKFIKNSDNEKEIGKSKNLLIWGVIGLFVLVTIWSILSFIKTELGLGGDVFVPQIYLK